MVTRCHTSPVFETAEGAFDNIGLVGKDRVEIDAVDQSSHADCIVTLAGQQVKPYEVAKGIGQGKDFGRPTAFRLSDRLILSSPFAPCP